MKRSTFFMLAFILLTHFLNGQIVVFHENFELPSGADSVISTTTGVQNWAINSTYSAGGNSSYYKEVTVGDSATVTTLSFSTIGHTHISLSFHHICKIHFSDKAEIYVSNNNGNTWIKLTDAHYLGSGTFGSFNSTFASLAYADWLPGVDTATPTNFWWKHEVFDISSLVAQSAQVKIMFMLRDGDNMGSNDNFGWLIDDIRVTGSTSELIPPDITITSTLRDTTYSTNAYQIDAIITDASGIDTAFLVYTVNGGTPDTIGMQQIWGSFYSVSIPSQPFNTLVCFKLIAVDSSPAHNISSFPGSQCRNLWIMQGPSVVTIGTGGITNSTTTYPAPYGNRFWGARHQFLITATELNAMGLSPGFILSLGFNVSTAQSTNLSGFTIKMGHTQFSALSNSFDESLTTVYHVTTYAESVGWTNHPFQTPFFWNGVDNLLIETCFNNSSATNNAIVQQSNTNYAASLFTRDNTLGICAKVTGTLVNQRPDIRLTTPVYNSNHDAGIAKILLQGLVPSNTNINLEVWVRNYGLDTLKKAQIFYSVNNGPTVGPVIWTGSLLQGMNSTAFNVGSIILPIGYNTVTVWTSLPNDSVDQNTINDALTAYLYACPGNLNGHYSVGGPGADFQTLDDAMASINTCGLGGNVVLNLASGVYPGQFKFINIPGTSDSTTLTIRSATGDPNDVVFILSTTGTENYTVQFFDAQYIKLKQVTVRSTNSSLGQVIYFDGNSRHITIDSCIVEAPIGTATTSRPIASNTSSQEYNITISNSIIRGGSAGISLVGSASGRKNKLTIINNLIEDFHANGMFIYYVDSVSIIGNTVINGTLSGTKRSIYLVSANGFNEISKNKVFLRGTGASTIYGIFVSGKLSTPDYLTIANNFVVHSGSTGEVHGIYLTSSNYVNILFNSVNITAGSNSTGRAFTQAGSLGGNLNILNNIFCNTGGGYAYYITTPSIVNTSDYNNFYKTGNNLAFWGGNRTTLAALQAASLKDSNSQSILPPFSAFDDLYLSSSALSTMATYLPSVPDDIDGNPRTSAPTIGAHEIPFIPFDAGVTSFIYPVASTVINQNSVVAPIVVVKNLGSDTINSMVIAYSVNNGVPVLQNYTNQLLPAQSDTVTLASFLSPAGSTIISAYTILAGDSNSFNDTCHFSYHASPAVDGQLNRIVTITEGCAMGADTLKVVISNQSAHTAPITTIIASYQLLGSPLIHSDTITTSLLPGDSLIHSFQTLIDFTVTSADSIFEIKAWIEIAGDFQPLNDTSQITVRSRFTPNPPSVSNPAIPYGTTTTLSAQSPHTVFWYQSNTTSIPFHSGTSYTTPLLYDTTVYWVEATTTIGSNGLMTVGSGTSTGSNSGPIIISATSSYVYSHHISILDPSELSGLSGFISSMAWQKTNSGAYLAGNAEMRIYLKHTTLSTIPSAVGTFANQLTGAILFYENTSQSIPASQGWMDFANNTSQQFLYNGTSRLMILVEWFRPGSATGPVTWSYTAEPGKAQSWAAGATPPNYTSGNGERPNVRISISALEGCESTRVPIHVFVNTAPANDAGIIAVVSPGATIPTGATTHLQVQVKNFGLNNLSSVEIHHRINGVLMPSYLLSGINLPKDSISQPVTISTNIYPLGSYALEVWTSLPNGMPDPANMNDTLHHNFITCLSGTYTLGTASSDFPTFTSAFNALNNYPLCDHVVFNVASGTYTQQLNFTSAISSGPNKTVTFQSATGDSTDVVIQFATSSSNNRVIMLDGVQHCIFRGMTFHATGQAQGRVIEFLNSASFITITNCVIKTSNLSTATAFSGIFCDFPSVSQNVVISNNKFIGGYYGITWTGNNGYIKNNLVIENNSMEDFYSAGIFNRYTDSLYIRGNTFSNRPGTGIVYGLYIQYAPGFGEIMKNRIILQGPQIQKGIFITDKSSNSNKYLTVANNFVAAIGSTSIVTGMEIGSANYVNLYYNSVNINGGDAVNGKALYIYLGSNVRVKNNSLVNVGGGYAYHVYASGNVSYSDYNNFYTTGPAIGIWASEVATLAALQSASNRDGNSINVNPLYQTASNLIPAASSGLYQAGNPIVGIGDDIFGNPRPGINPCIGAVEFVPSLNDAGLVAITSPGASVNGIDSVVVTVKNGGASPLTSVIINWEINGQLQPTFSWTGNIASNAIQPNVNIGMYNFISGSYDIKVWVSLPNGQPDGFAGNDTLVKNVIACLGYLKGVYTIGGTTADFGTVNAAVNALAQCGVDSSAVFLINTGSYNEQIEIPAIPGASALNTITFRSATGDSTDVVIEYSPTGIQAAFALALNGASHLQFMNITFRTSGTVSGRTVILKNGANHNLFQGCIIQAPITSQSHFSCVYTDNTSAEQFNVFKGNRILNGYHGFHIVGSTTNRKTGFVFENNHISGYYYYGIYALYTDSVLITKNTLTNSSPPSTTGNHIWVYYNQGYAKINKNKIHSTIQLTSTGIGFGHATSIPSAFAEISNNFISQSGTSTTFRGIAVYGNNTRVNILHNSVSVVSHNANGGCVHVSSGRVNMFGNNLANFGNAGHAFRLDSLQLMLASDHNNFYTTGINFIYMGFSCANLTIYQGLSYLDTNSVSTHPMYNSFTDLHSTSPVLDGAAKPIPGLVDDIDGDLRDPVAPDIGADEFVLQALDIAPWAVLSPVQTSSYVGAELIVSVRIRNQGTSTISSFSLAYQYSNQPSVNDAWNGLLLPGQTVDHTFSLPVALVLGTHELKIFTMLNGDQNLGNDTLSVFLTGQPIINLPWGDEFDSGVTEWIEEGSLWERGIPSGLIISSPMSAPNVWTTNLSGHYPAGAIAYLYSPYFNFTYATGAILEFQQWRAFSDNNDGGQVQVSINGGATWLTLGFSNDPLATNWYNWVSSGQHYFTGNSNGWVLSSYDLSSLNQTTTPVQFRFRFFSDITGFSDGWAIDNFSISLPVFSIDAAVQSIDQPMTSTVNGSQVTVQATIKNMGTTTLTSLPLGYRVDNQPVVNETWTGTLPTDSTTSFTFSTPYTSPNVPYSLCVFTKLAGDQNPLNDTMCSLLNTTLPPFDAGIESILQPTSTSIAQSQVTVTARIRNYGSQTLNTIPVVYNNGTVQSTETWSGVLLPGASVDYTFPTPFTGPLGAYTLCVRTQLVPDGDTTNDQQCVSVTGVIGIEEAAGAGFRVHQNRPNPAGGMTEIEVFLPDAGEVIFTLTAMPGVILRHIVELKPYGAHNLVVDLDGIPPGIYLYSVEFKGERVVKKMIVL
jgi:hypothetical protein